MMESSSHIFLVNKKQEILLQLRDDNIDICSQGYWGALGGRIEKNETPLNAIKREIKEEIGYCPKKIKYIGFIACSWRKIHFFVGHIERKIKDVHLTEGQRVDYFTLSQIKDLYLIPHVKKFILKNKEKILNDYGNSKRV